MYENGEMGYTALYIVIQTQKSHAWVKQDVDLNKREKKCEVKGQKMDKINGLLLFICHN